MEAGSLLKLGEGALFFTHRTAGNRWLGGREREEEAKKSERRRIGTPEIRHRRRSPSLAVQRRGGKRRRPQSSWNMEYEKFKAGFTSTMCMNMNYK